MLFAGTRSVLLLLSYLEISLLLSYSHSFWSLTAGKGDISKLLLGGHFYVGLTLIKILLDKSAISPEYWPKRSCSVFLFNLLKRKALKAAYPSPPGPRDGLTPIANLLQIRKDPIGYFCKAAKKYGDIVSIIQNGRVCLFTHPEHVRELLQLQHLKLRQGLGHKRLRFFLGEGLLTSDGERHREDRRKIQPEFHRKRIAGYAQLMSEKASSHALQWKDGQEVGIGQEFKSLTLAIVVGALFGTELKADLTEMSAAEPVLHRNIIRSTLHPFGDFALRFPTPENLRFKRAISVFDRIIYRLIREKIEAKAMGEDLISMLLELENLEDLEDTKSRGEQKKKKASLKRVRDQALTFFMAGHETTANGLTWTAYLLAKNPKVEAKMYNEIKKALQGKEAQLEDIPRLEYTAKVFKEALRLYPPAWLIGRTVVSEFKIDSYLMRKGVLCHVSPYITQRDPRWFPKPTDFLPERWTEDFEKGLPRYAYFPFGAGPRQCIGEAFAKLEGVIILANIFQKWKLRLSSAAYLPEFGHKITLGPKEDIPMRLERR